MRWPPIDRLDLDPLGVHAGAGSRVLLALAVAAAVWIGVAWALAA